VSGQIRIKQALRKAYRKRRPTREEIGLLRRQLAKMLDDANPRESEEYHKGLLKDFLNNTAYTAHFINTKDRTDMVIHSGQRSDSTVGVIIETKRPGNKTEMPTVNNLNKKAIQELLLYFLRERVTNENFELKHLVATDLYRWFIFDAHEFEKIAEDKKLRKAFKDFEEGRLTFEKTERFYKEIAGPAIERRKGKISFVYFDLHDYQKPLREQTKTGDISLIELQKILSPTHLLKVPFADDSNTLNKDFYNELLHIIGLEEYREKAKKLIRRKESRGRNEDAMIEAAITQIASLGKLSQVEDVERFGESIDERLYNIALELVITWVNRILFLKLLESQVVSYRDSKDYLFLNKEKVPEYDDLNTLFFQVLAVETKARAPRIKKKFPNVPYLNSSLFEPTKLEQQTIFISNLPDDTVLPLYRRTVLKTNSDKINTLEYLFRFLDAYDFGAEGSEEVAEDNKTLINASVLGLIFEKINGYKDGSFFTPGFITMYMSRETIRRAIVAKFKDQSAFEADTFPDLVNFARGTYKKHDIDKYNTIINSLKICDPAVGSGHFLVSALNEIIAIKAELELLTDEDGKVLRDYPIDVENDELIVLDRNGEFFKYDPENRETCRVQETLFREKLTIIENCLFGVDINPNSVHICRLRLWIELLKNAYYKEDGELETLPNIDINIKCGNSLISRYPLDADLKEVLQESRFSVDAYRIAVNTYRNAENKEQKQAIEEVINKIKGTFTAGIDRQHPKKQRLANLRGKLIALVDQGVLFHTESKKARQKKIEHLATEIAQLEKQIEEIQTGVVYRNAFEWRFEFPEVLDETSGDFVGFDIIIGNPPYGLFNKKQNQKVGLTIQKEAVAIIRRNYPATAAGGINACRVFYELALHLACKQGLQCMIIPFGILTDKSSARLRKHVFDNHSFLSIDAFPERDNKRRRVFEDVKMSTAIILSAKGNGCESFHLGVSYDRKIQTENRFWLDNKDVMRMNPDLCPIPITTPPEYEVLAKIYANDNLTRLANIRRCLTGEVDMTFAKKAMSQNKQDAVLLKGAQVDRFETKHDFAIVSQGQIEYLNLQAFRKVYSAKKLHDAYRKRIVLQGLTGVNETYRLKATIVDPPTFLANSCNYIVEPDEISLSILLALLNSKVLNFIFRCTSTSSNVNGYEVDNLPIPKEIAAADNEKLTLLPNQIMAAKKKDRTTVTAAMEAEIDQIVYSLYDLTPEDIAVIEAKYPRH